MPKTNNKLPKGFWKISKSDLICFSAMLVSTFTVWTGVYFKGSFSEILKYWDGPNYLYVAMTNYDIPIKNPWSVYYKYPPSYFACHLPGYPFLIKICSFMCFGNYTYGFHLSIIVSSLLFTYAFRRLLIVYNCVENSTLSTIIACFVPLRFTIYHSVGASEPLYISFICMAFIFYKIDSYFLMLSFVWLCCFTRIEGMAVGFAIGVCFLLSKDIIKAGGMFLTFLAPAALLVLHYYKFNDALAYIHFNQGSQKLVQWPPFSEAINQQQDERFNYAAIGTLLVGLLAAFMCFDKCHPIAIFALTHLLYVSLLFHIDLFRYQLPATVIVTAIGFSEFWNKKLMPIYLLIILPVYLVVVANYAGGQIHSNIAFPQFINAIFASVTKRSRK